MKVLRVPLALRIPLVLLPLAITAYWIVTYRGLYRSITEVELAVLGSHSPMLAGALCLLVMMGCSLVVLGVLNKVWPGEGVAVDPARGKRVDAWVKQHPVLLLAVIFAPMSLAVSGYFLVDAVTIGGLAATSADAIEAGGEPPSRFVDLDGRLQHSLAVGVRDDHVTTHYIPIVSRTWKSGDPVSVVLAVDERTAERELALAVAPYRGVLSRNDLPAVAISQLEGHLASTYWVLEYNASREMSVFMAATFGGLALLAGIGLLVGIKRGGRARSSDRAGARA